MKKYDVIIIGAGAAGLTAARNALSRGRSVAVLDMGDKPARKVFVSGGGRCNFTNAAAAHDRYVGQNPDFVRSALAAVKPSDILDWMRGHNLGWTEKAPGQYFCATSSDAIVNALMDDASGADIIFNAPVTNIEKTDDEFTIYGKNFVYGAKSIIIATGGTSFPNLMVSDFGYIIAKKFGHKIVPVLPGLVGLKTNAFSPDLAGISLSVEIKSNKKTVSDSLLFTHVGIGGPAVYRASLWDLSQTFHINFVPGVDIYERLRDAKKAHGRKSLGVILSLYMPTNLAKWFAPDIDKNIADFKDTELANIAGHINNFILAPNTLKRRDLTTAEVVIGGVSTADISSKTMESKLCPGLFFAGEVLDITGDLGGFNLHWAWASGTIAGINA